MNLFNYSLGKSLRFQYGNGIPYKHVVLDDFFHDTQMLDEIHEEFNQPFEYGYDPNQIENSRHKVFMPWNLENVSLIPTKTRKFLDYMNSEPVINFLQDLTGIHGLFGDPNFQGGGMHRIFRNGQLSVHEDFALHPINREWFRRVNLLVYLNKGWDSEWGGSLQLYDKKSGKMIHDILPLFNRVVIFNTTGGALHGHPHKLNCPQEVMRDSLALYYFTLTPPPEGALDHTAAQWYSLDNSGDVLVN